MRRTRIPTTLAALFAAGVGLAVAGNGAHAGDGIYANGWAPPARVPIHRIPIEYQRFYPSVWYGDALPPGYTRTTTAPVTYVPTDTMQQGYYYQRTPSWQPRPGMLPAPPRPDEWMMRQHQFGMPPTIYNVSWWRWHKHPERYRGYTHGPAVTPHGYGHGGYGVPVESAAPSTKETLPTPIPAKDDPNAATEDTALAPFLNR